VEDWIGAEPFEQIVVLQLVGDDRLAAIRPRHERAAALERARVFVTPV